MLPVTGKSNMHAKSNWKERRNACMGHLQGITGDVLYKVWFPVTHASTPNVSDSNLRAQLAPYA